MLGIGFGSGMVATTLKSQPLIVWGYILRCTTKKYDHYRRGLLEEPRVASEKCSQFASTLGGSSRHNMSPKRAPRVPASGTPRHIDPATATLSRSNRRGVSPEVTAGPGHPSLQQP